MFKWGHRVGFWSDRTSVLIKNYPRVLVLSLFLSTHLEKGMWGHNKALYTSQEKRSQQEPQFSCSVLSPSLWPHGLQHSRLPCPSATPRAYSNSCPPSPWCHPTISSSVIPFSSHLQSFQHQGLFKWVSSSEGRQNENHWRREWQITSVFLPWEPNEWNSRNLVSQYLDLGLLSLQNYVKQMSSV